MFSPLQKKNPLIKMMNNSLINLPTPVNLSIWWNFGSLAGLCLITQIITGLFLTMHYSPHVDLAFISVIHISRDVNFGWALRNIHANGASLFFLALYLHTARNMYYSSFLNNMTWYIGIVLLICVMATAFMGYVLVWGQMSFWGATVITNLFSAIPYVGKMLVEWLWGGFAVDNATLNRFFAFHFLLPFIIMGLVMVHLMFLHQTGSNNPLGLNSSSSKIPFHYYHSSKDMAGFILFIFMLFILAFFLPNILGDPENFLPANPLVTPVHIKPEWYFLWAYAILRSIPNKLGGVITMFSSLLILLILPKIHLSYYKSNCFYPPSQMMFWMFSTNICLLTWIGACPVEPPYELLGQIFTCLYFFFLLAPFFINKLWEKLM